MANKQCVHLGKETRTVGCAGCKGEIQLKVFQCNVHEECTIRKDLPEVKGCCYNCEEKNTNLCYCKNAGACPTHQSITGRNMLAQCQVGVPPKPTDIPPCIYLGAVHKRRTNGAEQRFKCQLYGDCVLKANDKGETACENCSTYTKLDDPEMAERFIDPLRITGRDRENTTVFRNMLQGGSAFLVLGGPSQKELPLERLTERGIFSLGVNNIAGKVQCDAFVCSDPPSKFHSGIWADPKIMKFIPTPKFMSKRGELQEREADGSFIRSEMSTKTAPNIYGFERRAWLMANESWFTADGATWGNHNKGVTRTGLDKTVNTGLLGLRLLQYLGARKIFLIGADFYMNPAAALTDNYAFAEDRDAGAITSNNRQFRIVNKWLAELRPVFERFGFETYNCFQGSHLRAFDYVPFERALEIARGKVPAGPFNLRGWYGKS